MASSSFAAAADALAAAHAVLVAARAAATGQPAPDLDAPWFASNADAAAMCAALAAANDAFGCACTDSSGLVGAARHTHLVTQAAAVVSMLGDFFARRVEAWRDAAYMRRAVDA